MWRLAVVLWRGVLLASLGVSAKKVEDLVCPMVMHNGCYCEDATKFFIDFTYLVDKVNMPLNCSAPDAYYYLFYPCEGEECRKGSGKASICEQQGEKVTEIGFEDTVKFVNPAQDKEQSESPYTVDPYLLYTDKVNVKSIVRLRCDYFMDEVKFTYISKNHTTYEFEMRSKHVCWRDPVKSYSVSLAMRECIILVTLFLQCTVNLL